MLFNMCQLSIDILGGKKMSNNSSNKNTDELLNMLSDSIQENLEENEKNSVSSYISQIQNMIDDLLTPKTFIERLDKHIQSKGYTDPEFYNMAGISRATFGYMRNPEYVPSKKTCYKCIFALEMNLAEAMMFLEQSGFTFLPGDPSDQIFLNCIKNKIYDKDQIDTLLYDNNLETLFT